MIPMHVIGNASSALRRKITEKNTLPEHISIKKKNIDIIIRSKKIFFYTNSTC